LRSRRVTAAGVKVDEIFTTIVDELRPLSPQLGVLCGGPLSADPHEFDH
jgi:hypothetical protein